MLLRRQPSRVPPPDDLGVPPEDLRATMEALNRSGRMQIKTGDGVDANLLELASRDDASSASGDGQSARSDESGSSKRSRRILRLLQGTETLTGFRRLIRLAQVGILLTVATHTCQFALSVVVSGLVFLSLDAIPVRILALPAFSLPLRC